MIAKPLPRHAVGAPAAASAAERPSALVGVAASLLDQCALGHAPLIANHAYNLSHVNAAQIEAGGPDAISLDALRWSAENNKLVQFHIEYGYPGTVPDFANSYQDCMLKVIG